MEKTQLQITPFRCKRGDLTIRGEEYRTQAGRLPILIVSHGFMANMGTVRQYALAAAELGFAAYIFDFCGGCAHGKSDGLMTDMTVWTEVEDLRAVVDYARSLPDNDPERVTLMGGSQGGFVSALLAAELGERVERLVLLYPALCIPDDARAGKNLMFTFDPANVPDVIGKGPLKLGGDYVRTMQPVDPFEAIRPYPGPVLIVHGTEDKIVNPRYSERARDAYNSTDPRRCQLAVLEGAGHGFDKRADEAALELLRPFLLGMSLVLEVDVKLSEDTGFTWTPLGMTRVLPFTGSVDTPWFRGEARPGAKDVQETRFGRIRHFCAEYDLDGTDYTGAPCRIRVKNENFGHGWVPTLLTDSPALNFLNTAPAATAVEGRPGGVTVRIFAKAE